jgi:predicted CXXCH cytochrome family protein
MHNGKSDIAFIFLLIVFFILAGCSHKVLTVFFDGVPEPVDSAAVAVKKSDSLKRDTVAGELAGNQRSVHPPFKKKKCSLCHDPNSTRKFQMPQPELCYQCHDNFALGFKFVHGPAGGGYCTSCHNPHQSDLPKLLARKGQQLCLTCHDQGTIFKQPAHKDNGDSDCTSCHNPHGGNKRYFLAGREQ